MNEPLFKIEKCRFSYGSEPPVVSIDYLELYRGRITSFRGHNGSGKTTLLKLLSGLLEPDQGTLGGKRKKGAVLVDQEPYMFQGSVLHNLVQPLRFHGVPHSLRSERIAEALKMVGLEGFEQRRARDLSGGEKKRVAIARSLVTEPDLIFLDEPDANVDVRTSRELESLMFSLKKKGISLFLATHNSAMAYRVSDEIIDLYKGRIIDHYENILKGEYLFSDNRFSEMKTGGQSIICPSRHGIFTTAVISPQNVFLARTGIDRVGQNQFEGKILSIVPFKDNRFIISVDCGIMIKSQLSSTALEMLEASPGDNVFAMFPPAAVYLY